MRRGFPPPHVTPDDFPVSPVPYVFRAVVAKTSWGMADYRTAFIVHHTRTTKMPRDDVKDLAIDFEARHFLIRIFPTLRIRSPFPNHLLKPSWSFQRIGIRRADKNEPDKQTDRTTHDSSIDLAFANHCHS